MKVAIHLRGGNNKTNMRSQAIADGFYEAGHHVEYLSRAEASKSADLVVQTGFNNSTALQGAMDRGVPYLIMEAPPFRTLHPFETHSSFGYNGLAGGAFRPEVPDEERPKPEAQPLKESGETLIIGQKPTDHSLRGSDHVAWLEAKLREYPEARFRHHPIMVSDTPNTIEEALEEIHKVIVYTSTCAVDAAIAGCEVVVEGSGCWWDPGKDRERQIHELSWAGFRHQEFATRKVVDFILSGYEEAREYPYEIPRGKVDGRTVCEQYYKRVVR